MRVVILYGYIRIFRRQKIPMSANVFDVSRQTMQRCVNILLSENIRRTAKKYKEHDSPLLLRKIIGVLLIPAALLVARFPF